MTTVDPDDVLKRLPELPGGPALLDAATGLDAHLVGGAVRDIALERAPRELDVVVAGDPEPLIAALDGEVQAHERFGTAVVTLADGALVDVVRARRESYAAPGALPDVAPGTLADDLARRDVSVNAIAVALDGRGVAAVPGAFDDLAAGILRVLHDGSFADDPTRLWRVARYAARLGFSIDDHTRALAGAADPATVSGPRLGAELRLALREPDPAAALRIAQELNPRFVPTGFAARDAAAALALLDGEGRADLVVLAASTGGVDAATLLRWLDELAFPAADRDLVAVASRSSTAMPLRTAERPSEIARAARGAPVEVVALAGGPAAERWLRELRHVDLQISGDDLLAAGIPRGPEIGARLRDTLDRVLDGEVSGDRDAELAAALEADVVA